jgi:CheY-like chemotaxis protein
MTRYKNILLVDDDKDDQEVFVEVLQAVDASLTWAIADNGKLALDLLPTLLPQKPDIIFLDINMPVMDGFGFLRRIKAMDEYKDIPVLILSTSPVGVENAYALGACLFLSKPYSMPAYIALVKLLLSRDVVSDCDELRAMLEEMRVK